MANSAEKVKTMPSFDLKPGQSLGNYYKILEFLGKGWEGEVYKVEEKATGILRAAKLFYPKRHKKHQKPHIEYAKKLFKLKDCPIVIQYHHQDLTMIEGVPYDFMVSEYIDGMVLSEMIEMRPGKRLNLYEALHLFYALVLGIEHIHFLGEYHGDLHPDNIIVRRKGVSFQVYLIDFLNLGKSNKQEIAQDVHQLIKLLHFMLGGTNTYRHQPKVIKELIKGCRLELVTRQFKDASHIRIYLDNLEW